MAEREAAQRKRAEGRKRRRAQSDDEQPEAAEQAPETRENGGEEQPLEAVMHAAKVAAAGAAVGAAAAAARALTRSREHDGSEGERSAEGEGAETQKPDPASRAEAVQAERGSDDGRAEESEPQEAVEDEERLQSQQAAVAQDGDRQEPGPAASPDEARAASRRAREQLEELLERTAESVSSLERTNDGWRARLEVVELARVPESTDVLATYEVELDDDGNLRRYSRVTRYHRAHADTEDFR